LGVGSPSNVRELIKYLTSNGIRPEKLAGHFHDTYGQAVANVWEAFNNGIRVFDSSVAGLGGCPFAPGAKGNVASEDLVYMFHNAGISTGIDLPKLVETGVWISKQLSKSNSSRAGTALSTKSQPATNPSMNFNPIPTSRLKWHLFTETEGLQIYRSGVNLKLVLNRPKNGNTLTATMISGLTQVISKASTDHLTSRIIITANGKFFCTGMDLSKGSTAVGGGGSSSDAQFEGLTRLFEAIDQCPKVTIAAVNGPAFGGGVGLAFSCDMRIFTRGANVTLSEVKLGLCAATISKYVIRELGAAFSREIMLSARAVTAGELKGLGVISEIAEDQEDLRVKLDELLIRLKIASPNASRMSKELVRLAWAHEGGVVQASGIKTLFRDMMRSDADGAYGVTEFQAKRKVDWDDYVQRRKAKL
jgi:hydroxymethylglutaryl-CoA lyase